MLSFLDVGVKTPLYFPVNNVFECAFTIISLGVLVSFNDI